MLRLYNVSKRFGGIFALRGINLEIKEGELVGLIGPNGSGKTTLINIVTGVYRPDTGLIEYMGENLLKIPRHEICKRGITRTFQIPRPFGSLSVLDNLLIAGEFCGKLSETWINELLRMLGLWEKRNNKSSNLTLIEKRLLELGRALAPMPKLVFLDEVAAGLRESEIKKIGDIIRSLNTSSRVTVVWVEHNIRELIKYIDKLIVLNNGQLLIEGEPISVLSNKLVVETYLGKAGL